MVLTADKVNKMFNLIKLVFNQLNKWVTTKFIPLYPIASPALPEDARN